MMLRRWRQHAQRHANLRRAGASTASFADRSTPAPYPCHESSRAKNNFVSLQDLLASNPQRNYELAFNWERALQWWPQAAWKDALRLSSKSEHARLAALLQQSGPSNHYYLLRRHPELAVDVLKLVVNSTDAFAYVNPLHRDMDIIKVLRQMALAIGDDNMLHAAKTVIHQRCLSKESARCTPCLYRSLCAATDTTSAPQLREILRHLIHHRLVPEILTLLEFATEQRIPIDVWRRIFNMFIHASFEAPEAPTEITSGDEGDAGVRFRVVQDVALQFMAHVEARPIRISEGIAASVIRAAVHHGEADTALTCYDWFRQRQVPLCNIAVGHLMQLLRPGQHHASMQRFQQIYDETVAARGVSSLSAECLAMTINAAAHDIRFLRRVVGDLVAPDAGKCHLDVGMCNVALKGLVNGPDCEPNQDFPLAQALGHLMHRSGIVANRGSLVALLRASDDKLAVLQVNNAAEAIARTVPRKHKHVNVEVDTLSYAAHVAIVDLIKSGDVRTASDVRDAVLASSSGPAAFSPALWQTMVLSLMHHKGSFDFAIDWMRVAEAHVQSTHVPLFADYVFSTWFTLAMKHRKLVANTDDAPFVLAQWRRQLPTSIRQDDVKRFDLAITTCCHANDIATATDLWHDMVAAFGAPSANAASAMLQAMDRLNKDFEPFFYSELYSGEVNSRHMPPMSVLQAALFAASHRKKHKMVRDVIDLLMKIPPSQWNAAVYRNALYCCAESSVGELVEIGLELIEWFITERLPFDPDEYSLFDSLRIAKQSPPDDQYAILHAYSERNRWPNLMAYTMMMEAHLQAKAPSSYGNMVVDMMAAQQIPMDLKFATVYALLLLQNHNHVKLLDLIRTMVHDANVPPDEYFFHALLTTVADQSDIDGCFELVASITSIGHFEALYMALIHVGLAKGVLERVCNVVVQMECEGFAISSTALVKVIDAVRSNREMEKVVSIVAQLVGGGPRTIPFDATVFAALWTQLARFQCANKVSLKYLHQHAAAHGFDRPVALP
ncbi:hypothetical protein H310_09490 [Aphanomyces invadans]|uniref:Pentacotripeptide-repeat region of PRORP domain-containing protein n=1 Tax=Aphanomyces invadans TaxID=157072 RepID=A0A024TUC2_9STRA|nr:hypothetical protein H310_09490 [Aphanomyces invadans]ETV97594.1 hypothetical protein H310_09490 [Aphanomyces invadans]|eukprot:XP_008873803.1 hypothetical protein H310_09490 [Aphanomyces invadans]